MIGKTDMLTVLARIQAPLPAALRSLRTLPDFGRAADAPAGRPTATWREAPLQREKASTVASLFMGILIVGGLVSWAAMGFQNSLSHQIEGTWTTEEPCRLASVQFSEIRFLPEGFLPEGRRVVAGALVGIYSVVDEQHVQIVSDRRALTLRASVTGSTPEGDTLLLGEPGDAAATVCRLQRGW